MERRERKSCRGQVYPTEQGHTAVHPRACVQKCIFARIWRYEIRLYFTVVDCALKTHMCVCAENVPIQSQEPRPSYIHLFPPSFSTSQTPHR